MDAHHLNLSLDSPLALKEHIGGSAEKSSLSIDSSDMTLPDGIMVSKGHLPLIFSADAEPTLVNRKIIGSQKVPYTNTIHTIDSVEIIASIISEDLKEIGINQNYAPVIDASPNKVVSNRSFGLNMDTVISFSNKFINTTQNQGIHQDGFLKHNKSCFDSWSTYIKCVGI